MQVCTVRTLVSRIAVIRAVLVLLPSDLICSPLLTSPLFILLAKSCCVYLVWIGFFANRQVTERAGQSPIVCQFHCLSGISKIKLGKKGR